jgi:hypothetical protein
MYVTVILTTAHAPQLKGSCNVQAVNFGKSSQRNGRPFSSTLIRASRKVHS